ncbi:MAG: hypothetical protein Roseis2KO_50320 [Roseivirga sp.]
MKKSSTSAPLTVLCILTLGFIYGCDAISAEEVARLSFEKTASQEDLNIQSAELELKAGDKLQIWTEMSMEYEGSLGLEYQLLMIKGADTLAMYQLDPEDKDVTMGEVKTSFGSETKWRFSGRMTKITIEDDGLYIFSSVLAASENPSLKLKKADLVLKK